MSERLKKVATAIIEDDEGRLLVQRREEDKEPYGGMWTLFGGRVEEGESVEEALWRELTEELGLKKKMVREWWEWWRDKEKYSSERVFYVVKVGSGVEVELREGAEMEWADPERVLAREFGFGIDKVLEIYLADRD